MVDNPELIAKSPITKDRDFLRSTLWLPGEREKTKSEKALIGQIIQYMDRFAVGYGAKSLPLTVDMVHIIGDLEEFNKGTGKHARITSAAQYFPEDQNIALYPSSDLHPEFGNLQQALKISHELLHLYSFQSFKKIGVTITERRTGLAMKDKDDSTQWGFSRFNEAITEELNKKFVSEYFYKIKGLRGALAARTRAVEKMGWEESRDVACLDSRGYPEKFSYEIEREILDLLCRDISEKNPEEYDYSIVVFGLFAKTYFTGEILNLARLVDYTYGRGSMPKLYRIANDIFNAKYVSKLD